MLRFSGASRFFRVPQRQPSPRPDQTAHGRLVSFSRKIGKTYPLPPPGGRFAFCSLKIGSFDPLVVQIPGTRALNQNTDGRADPPSSDVLTFAIVCVPSRPPNANANDIAGSPPART